jgi:hypothetical protein
MLFLLIALANSSEPEFRQYRAAMDHIASLVGADDQPLSAQAVQRIFAPIAKMPDNDVLAYSLRYLGCAKPTKKYDPKDEEWELTQYRYQRCVGVYILDRYLYEVPPEFASLPSIEGVKVAEADRAQWPWIAGKLGVELRLEQWGGNPARFARP